MFKKATAGRSVSMRGLFVMGALLVALLAVCLPSQAHAEVTTYDQMVTQVGNLEVYAQRYIDNNNYTDMDAPTLATCYIRSTRYGDGNWSIVGGSVPDAFVTYCQNQDAANSTDVQSLRTMGDITLPNNQVTDAVHMFANLQVLLKNNGAKASGDLAGWLGDTCDLFTYDTNGSYATPEMAYTVAKKHFNVDGGFGPQDVKADLDAYNLYASYSTSLVSTLSAYFTASLDDITRVQTFDAGRLAGVATTTDDYRTAVYSAYTGNIYIPWLEYSRHFSGTTYANNRKGCCWVVADYLLSFQPTVTGVTVTPATATVNAGATGNTQTFTAAVAGENRPSQDVTWSVSGAESASTSIDADGTLTVGADETAATLIVKATSTYDATKSGTATVTVKHPAVTSVTVTPAIATVNASATGNTQAFSAAVEAVDGASTAVAWTVSGAESASTSIAADGTLTVGADETAASLTVIATSAFDATKSATAAVRVLHPAVTSVAVDPDAATLGLGGTQAFSAAVEAVDGASTAVAWTVSGAESASTSISADGTLTVGADETAASLTVTATSAFDATKSATAAVRCSIPPSPPSPSIPTPPPWGSGGTQAFSAAVEAVDGASTAVAWTVSGASASTSIAADGTLTVGADETAASLTVTATSAFDATKSATAAVGVLHPAVTSVAVDPDAAALGLGGTQAFSAAVEAVDGASTAVAWTVSGAESASTSISADGTLTVGADETAASLTVTATSAFDATKSATAAVGVLHPVVNGVTVTPATSEMALGATKTFSAAVDVADGAPTTVTWTVKGNTSATTAIDASGKLTVGADEKATALTVKATSTFDTSKYGTAVITVQQPAVTAVSVSPTATTVDLGSTQAFTADVQTVYGAPATLAWTVSGSTSAATAVASDGTLTVGADETATKLIVTATSTFDASKKASATVVVPHPAVTGITVTPGSATVLVGSTQTFGADVAVVDGASSTVSWKVSGATSASTVIDASGKLTVGADEKATAFTVIATSVFDATKVATATVTVQFPAVDKVVIATDDQNVTVTKGVHTFTADVTVTGGASNAVKWSISGSTSSATSIDADGKLTVGADETASEIVVTATSVFDPTQSSSVTVKLSDSSTQPGANPEEATKAPTTTPQASTSATTKSTAASTAKTGDSGYAAIMLLMLGAASAVGAYAARRKLLR